MKEASDVGGGVERWRVGSGIDRVGRFSCARAGAHRSAMSSSVRISCWPIFILRHPRGVVRAVDGGGTQGLPLDKAKVPYWLARGRVSSVAEPT